MRSPKSFPIAHRAAHLLGLSLLAAASGALAAPMSLYSGPAITDTMKADPRACLNIGDAISCSAGMLNLLHQQYTGIALPATGSTALDETNPSKVNGYIIAPSGQGQLKQAIVLGSGGSAANPNETIDPLPTKAEDGFKTNNAGDNYAATGKTGQTAGNLSVDNNINGLNPAYNRAGTWDVELGWLIEALKVPAGSTPRRELMIGFDYNQPNNSTGSVDYWALITLIDYNCLGVNCSGKDASGADTTSPFDALLNPYKQINFEIKADFSGYAAFISGKQFNDQPAANEFLTVNTKTCYKLDGSGNVIDVIPTATGTCAAGYSSVNNATGDSTTEIIAFLPELNSGLETYLGLGYDAISVRMLFGCFGTQATTGDTNKAGQGYLSSGSTTNCDGGGNVDVFLMAGNPQPAVPPPPIPEPGSIALVGLGLGLLGLRNRRRTGR